MPAFPPSVADFKAYFVREFLYGTGPATVMDGDVQRGLNEAALDFNTGVWVSVAEQIIAYLYVAAHFMVLNIQGAGGLSATNLGKGVQSKGGGTIESKGAGSLNVGFAVPDFVRQSPILSQFMRTDFGQKYIQLLAGRLVGNLLVLAGGSAFPGGAGFGGQVATLVVVTGTLPGGVQAAPYALTLAAAGGVAPLTWNVTSGTLPVGLTLDPSTGVLAGTPTTIGTSYFTVTVTDRLGSTAAMNYNLVVT